MFFLIDSGAAVSLPPPRFHRRSKSPSLNLPFPLQFSRFPPRRWRTIEFVTHFPASLTGVMKDRLVKAEAALGEVHFEPILEEGVFRFDFSENDRNAAFPSLSFVDPNARETPIVGNGKVPEFLPTFERLNDQHIVKFQFPSETSFYGTGEVSGQLERTGKRIFTWNTDAWGYSPETTSLYQSHPWVLVVLPDGKALGVLADTTRRCEIDLREKSIIKLSSISAYPVITFGPFESPTEVLMSLSHAVGTVFMPPKWTLGYHQCRWSYKTEERVREIATNFRERGIPCDAIWMDIDYMHGFRCFTFDEEHFPDPKTLVKDLHALGIKAVWMLDPGIKHEEGYSVFDSGSNSNVWTLKDDGKPYVGEVWPGPCVFPDFTQQKVRSWWANLVKDFVSTGVDGIWNDMNEPSIFKTVTKTMPESNIHNADTEIGGRQKHTHYHNIYGLLMARSTYEGMKMANHDKRPFVLTRAGFIGYQRYASTWTGDNLSTWEHLHMSISMVLQLGLSGQPFSGPDIGGFAGNATPRLFGRWMGVGAMFPFCRGHSEAGTIDQEPWSFGKECEEVCRLALLRRYRLIPHIYTLFYEAHRKGIPVLTPTYFADSKDKRLRNVENSFLLGPLLICASTVPEQGANELSHELPNGTWMRFDFGDSHPDLPILYLQGGSIIPVGPAHQHLGDANLTDILSLYVALDINGKAKGFLFEDDGDGYGYTKGAYLMTFYAAELKSSAVVVRITKTEGSWRRPNRPLHVHILLGHGAMIEGRGVDGEELHIPIPSESEASQLMLASEAKYQDMLDKAKHLLDANGLSANKGVELSKTPVEIKGRDWLVKVVPWIGGRMISMIHLPSATQWLHSRVEIDGYEEYSSVEYRSAGCSEEYKVTGRKLEQSGEEEALYLEGDIGGGLYLDRKIFIPKGNPQVLQINSGIIARNVGAGSGGFSRLVCLRVHPTFALLHPTEVSIVFKSIDGLEQDFGPEAGNKVLEGDLRPNGEWMLVDRCADLCLVNKFDTSQVSKCLIHWGSGTVNLELWSAERPVSKETPLFVCHQYEVKNIPKP